MTKNPLKTTEILSVAPLRVVCSASAQASLQMTYQPAFNTSHKNLQASSSPWIYQEDTQMIDGTEWIDMMCYTTKNVVPEIKLVLYELST